MELLWFPNCYPGLSAILISVMAQLLQVALATEHLAPHSFVPMPGAFAQREAVTLCAYPWQKQMQHDLTHSLDVFHTHKV